MLNATAVDQSGLEHLTDCIQKYYLSTSGIPVRSGEIVRMRAGLISAGTDKFARFMKKTVNSEGEFSVECNFEGESVGGSPIKIHMKTYMREDDHSNEPEAPDDSSPEEPGTPVDPEPEVPVEPDPTPTPPDVGEGEDEWDEAGPADEPAPISNDDPSLGEGEVVIPPDEWGDDESSGDEGEDKDPKVPPPPLPEEINKYILYREYDVTWTSTNDGIHMSTFSKIFESTKLPDLVIAMVGDVFKIVNHLLECEFIEITKEQYEAAVDAMRLTDRKYTSSCQSCGKTTCKDCNFACKAEVFSDMGKSYLCGMCNSAYTGIRYYYDRGVYCPRCTYTLIIQKYYRLIDQIDLCSYHTCLCMPDEMLIAVVDQLISTYDLPIQKITGKS